jgi:hypothetical protein
MAGEIFDPSDDELRQIVTEPVGSSLTGAARGRAEAMREYSSLERSYYTGKETEEALARRVFRQALPNAAAGIVDIAMNSTNDRTRLTACQYIVERNLGKVGDDVAFAGDNALAAFVQGIEEDLKNS